MSRPRLRNQAGSRYRTAMLYSCTHAVHISSSTRYMGSLLPAAGPRRAADHTRAHAPCTACTSTEAQRTLAQPTTHTHTHTGAQYSMTKQYAQASRLSPYIPRPRHMRRMTVRACMRMRASAACASWHLGRWQLLHERITIAQTHITVLQSQCKRTNIDVRSAQPPKVHVRSHEAI